MEHGGEHALPMSLPTDELGRGRYVMHAFPSILVVQDLRAPVPGSARASAVQAVSGYALRSPVRSS